ncbi:unnamed protein product [Durusdinium trenchii]|uniref:UBA domain-containing protein n=2 Tax=Durusdinium trenchii TaxID=1381693 RepID=A0ABP0J626_9DINO
MASPSCMEKGERKRQYAALGRAVHKSCSPQLLAKYQLCSDSERWSMLKQWLLSDGKVDDITVEERYTRWTEQLRSDRYVTVTKLQLYKTYGKSSAAKKFIEEILKGQVGVPHPRCPNLEEAKMYKALKEVAENTTSGMRGDSSLMVGGRVRSASMKEMIAKQLNIGLQSLEAQGLMDLKTGRIQSKKPKKEKSPAQLALTEAKNLASKWKKIVKDIPQCLEDFKTYGIRNSSELERALSTHLATSEKLRDDAVTKSNTPLSDVDPEDMYSWVEDKKSQLAVVEQDVRDAKRRVSACKKPKKSKAKAEHDGSDPSSSDGPDEK